MRKLIIGTRNSELAVMQSNLVKNAIETKLPYEVEIVPISSLGDIDTISQLNKFRGSGVFSGKIERYLLEKKIDLAVHSLKDLPILDTEGLRIIAHMKRNDLTDSLLIKKDSILSLSPLKLIPNTKIATGSPRRQVQLKNFDPSVILLDIRGNVNSRIDKLNSSFIDGLVMASAVFERLNLELPQNVIRVKLPISQFPTAPGQGAIAVQVREDEFEELSVIGDKLTSEAVITERKFLDSVGGGCDISIGISAIHDNNWTIYCSIPPNTKFTSPLSYFQFSGSNLDKLYDQLRSNIKGETIYNLNLENKKIVIARDYHDSKPYRELLDSQGAITSHMQLLDFKTNYSLLEDKTVVDKWENADWIILSSKRAVEFLLLLNKLHPRSSFRVGVVGSSTANLAREAGLPIHYVANGSMNDLRGNLSEVLKVYPGKILYITGEKYHQSPSEDAEIINVYSAFPVKPELPFLPDMIVVFSKRSAKIIIEEFGKEASKFWIAIGKTTADYLNSQQIKCYFAEKPTPEGVLKILEELL